MVVEVEVLEVVNVDGRRRDVVGCVAYDLDVEGVVVMLGVEVLEADVVVVVSEVDEVLDAALVRRTRCRLVDCVAYDLDIEGVVVMLGVEVLEADVVVVVALANVDEVLDAALVGRTR